MLSDEKNRLLTEVGRGKPMGELLRRYWHPIAGVSEFDDKATKAMRLFGEDLVLYKDLSGQYGLLERHCPHRNADLSYGFVEEHGIRCAYHGWQFDRDGQCLHQPFEEAVDAQSRMRKATKTIAYLVQEKAGMLWAYMGPQPAPQLPDWDIFSYENGFAQAVFAEIPCNWFQCQENSIDPVHFEWTHNNWGMRLHNIDGPYVPTHLKIKFEEVEHGFIYKRIRQGETEANPLWSIGRMVLWPNCFYLGHQFEWRIPIDDNNTLSVLWVFCRVPKEQEPYMQKHIPSWYGPIKDPLTNRWITSHVINQDFVSWVGQGTITDRTREKLGQSDTGVVMMRKRFFDEIDAMQQGKPLKGLIWDPKKNHKVALPSACEDELVHGLTRAEMNAHPLLGPFLRDFFVQAGQPEDVRRAYEEAVGQPMQNSAYFKVHGSSQTSKNET